VSTPLQIVFFLNVFATALFLYLHPKIITMKKIIIIILILCVAVLGVLYFMKKPVIQLTDYVDPMIGTGGHGHTFPGATVPFGMVQLSPDTRIDGSWDGCSGYHFSDSVIYGFSHTHLSGTGCSDYGDIMLMPTTKNCGINPKEYSSSFLHKNEKAKAGYYSVKMDNGLNVELTATTRVGFHKYTFPKEGEKNVVLDLLHRDKLLQGSIKIVDDHTIEGLRRSEAWAKDQYCFYRIEFSERFIDRTIFKNDTCDNGVLLKFKLKENQELYAKVAISTVSAEGAKKNMDAELSGWDFEKTKKEAETLWNKELGKIEVKSDNKDKLKTFYTALYHTMIQPNVNMDVDGMYRGRDNKIHKAEGFTYYSVFSLWDTFRAAHPLYTIIDRKRTLDFIKTFLAEYKDGGRLPVWELASNETDCMIGYHSVSVIADAATKGITDFDMPLALEAMKKSATWNHLGLPALINHGYLAMEDESESVSKTLEYAYDDWCIAQLAKLVKNPTDYDVYMNRSQYWKNMFDPETGFMRPRKNGGWLSPFEPREVNNNYTEGNSWQYTFFVPQDIYGLIEMMGGKDKFEKKLDSLFTTSNKTTGREQPDISGLIGQYAHGNEPSHHMAYLYDYVNKPEKTQQRIHQIVKDFYKPTPDGLIGNEDCGQMSAWYVLSSLGIYEVTPGCGYYVFGTPTFREATINLENGKKFTFAAKDVTDDNYLEQPFKLDEKEYHKNFITYGDIMNGGTLSFTKVMDIAPTPPANFNSNPSSIVVTPIIIAASRVFKDSMRIELKSNYHNTAIYYTDNDATPNQTSKRYTASFSIRKTTKIKAIAINDKGEQSSITTGIFNKLPHPDWKVNILSKYNPQYTAGGDDGLIDGIRGDVDWRKGEWQGYQGQDFEAIIDMGKKQNVSAFSAGFLQDTRSWILMPTKVEFYVSNDNKDYKLVASEENKIKHSDLDSKTYDFHQILPVKTSAKYVKIKAYNYGKLPSWHQGAGGDAFIFIDEINIK
jgi:predicted alpha-1,2-mannosidase